MRALALVACVGCYTGKVAPPAAPTAPVKPKVERDTDDLLAFLPANAQGVAVIDLDDLRRSSLWVKVEELARTRAADVFTRVKDHCHFDAISSLHKISFAITDTTHPTGVIVVRGYPRAATMTCIKLGQAYKPSAKVTIDRDVVTIEDADTHGMLAFVDDTTMVIGFAKQPIDRQAFERSLGDGAPLRGDPVFTERIAKLDPDHPTWFLMSDLSKLAGASSSFGVTMKSILISLQLRDDLVGRARVSVADPQQAATFAATMQSQAATIKATVDELTAVDDGADVVIGVRMTPAQLDFIFGLVGGAIP
jgi:hypothetical protein